MLQNDHPREQIKISELKSSAGFKDFHLLQLCMRRESTNLLQVLAIKEGIVCQKGNTSAVNIP